MNNKITEPVVEPLMLRGDDTDYDSDFSQVSCQSEKLMRNLSKRSLECKRKVKPLRTDTKNVTFSPRTNVDKEDITIRRQKLEFNLSNVQVEESLSTDYHKKLQQRYERVESTLDALCQYIDAVSLEMKACYRLSQQLNALLLTEKSLGNDENMIKLTKKICRDTDLSFQYQVKDKIYMILQEKSDLNKLVEEYNSRRGDFKIASQNFKILLDTANLNIKQMDKLQRQYDKILSNYQHSRCMLDNYIPEEITEKIGVLLDCLCEFGEDLQRMAAERTDMSQMFRHLQSNMKMGDGGKIEKSKCIENQDSANYNFSI